MLNLKVNDYRITSDENNITVNKVMRDEKGNIKFKEDSKKKITESVKLVGYYRNLEKALEAIQMHHVYSGKNEIQTIEEYKESLLEITNDFKEQLKL